MRVAIVDDEPPARRLLGEILEAHGDVRVVSELATGDAAVAGLAADGVDLLFLDIELPDMSGFDVLARLPAGAARSVVFVTAHDHFALRAFDVAAIDYVLKPFDDERIARALARARERLAGGDTADLARLLQAVERLSAPADRYLTRLPLGGEGDRTVLLRVGDIRWIEAAGKHARVYAGGAPGLVRDTLGSLERVLDPQRFLRISRSAIVNLDRVEEIRPWFRGDFVVMLQGGAKVRSTPSYRDSLARLLHRDPAYARPRGG